MCFSTTIVIRTFGYRHIPVQHPVTRIWNSTTFSKTVRLFRIFGEKTHKDLSKYFPYSKFPSITTTLCQHFYNILLNTISFYTQIIGDFISQDCHPVINGFKVCLLWVPHKPLCKLLTLLYNFRNIKDNHCFSTL